LSNYFLMKIAETRAVAHELVEMGELRPARVEGWKEPAFIHKEAESPVTLDCCALLSPFDSLSWGRDRTKRLFDFEFSFELYVPLKKRQYGYYVMPILAGDRLLARVDLKVDRKRSALLVPGAFTEHGTDARAFLPLLVETLEQMAEWLGVNGIEVGDRGNLVYSLRRRFHG
jgi:uncharacterized protein